MNGEATSSMISMTSHDIDVSSSIGGGGGGGEGDMSEGKGGGACGGGENGGGVDQLAVKKVTLATLDMARKERWDECLHAMKEDLTVWFNTLYELDIDVAEANLLAHLDTGALLCRHGKAVNNVILQNGPGTLEYDILTNSKCPNASLMTWLSCRETAVAGSFQARDNIANFLAWCRGLLRLSDSVTFETEDLVKRRNERNVVLCLLEVARHGAKHGMLAPDLVRMEAEIDAEIAASDEVADREQLLRKAMDQQSNGESESIDASDDGFNEVEVDEEEKEEDMEIDKEGKEDNNSVIDDKISTPLKSSSNQQHPSRASPTKTPKSRRKPPTSLSTRRSSTDHTPPARRNLTIEVDMMTLDEMVRLILGRCTCNAQYPMIRIAEGKYMIGENLTLIFVRILRNHVMVRIGGGWDTLDNYLNRHDPCRLHMTGRPSQGGMHGLALASTAHHRVMSNVHTSSQSDRTSGTMPGASVVSSHVDAAKLALASSKATKHARPKSSPLHARSQPSHFVQHLHTDNSSISMNPNIQPANPSNIRYTNEEIHDNQPDIVDWQTMSYNVARSKRNSVTSAGSLDTTMSDSLQTLSTSETGSVRSNILSPCDDCKSFTYERDGHVNIDANNANMDPETISVNRNQNQSVIPANRHQPKDNRHPISHGNINKFPIDKTFERIPTSDSNACVDWIKNENKCADFSKLEKSLVRRKSSAAIRPSSAARILPSRPSMTPSKAPKEITSSTQSFASNSETNRAMISSNSVTRRSSLVHTRPMRSEFLHDAKPEVVTSPLSSAHNKKNITTVRKNLLKDSRIEASVAMSELDVANNLIDSTTDVRIIVDKNVNCHSAKITLPRHSNSFAGRDVKLASKREDKFNNTRTRIPRPTSAIERISNVVGVNTVAAAAASIPCNVTRAQGIIPSQSSGAETALISSESVLINSIQSNANAECDRCGSSN